jgi:hypothetical protein
MNYLVRGLEVLSSIHQPFQIVSLSTTLAIPFAMFHIKVSISKHIPLFLAILASRGSLTNKASGPRPMAVLGPILLTHHRICANEKNMLNIRLLQ